MEKILNPRMSFCKNEPADNRKFCQIAYGTKFLLNDANHQMNGFSTFPFLFSVNLEKGVRNGLTMNWIFLGKEIH